MSLWRIIVKYNVPFEIPKGAISPIIRNATNYSELDFKTKDLKTIEELPVNYIRLDIIKWDPPEEVPYDLDRNIKNFKKYVENEEYWYAHEEIEAIWSNSKGGNREIIQNIILLLAAMVHYQMNKQESFKKLFSTSLNELKEKSIIKSEIVYSYPLGREYVFSLVSYLDQYSRYEKYEENKAEN